MDKRLKREKKGRYPICGRTPVSKRVVYCPDCNSPYVVYRGLNKNRTESLQAGHIKDLWCFKCQAVKKHIQASHQDAKYNY